MAYPWEQAARLAKELERDWGDHILSGPDGEHRGTMAIRHGDANKNFSVHVVKDRVVVRVLTDAAKSWPRIMHRVGEAILRGTIVGVQDARPKRAE